MVFVGGLCYGGMLPLARGALDHGFIPGSAVVIHNLFASVILVPVVLIFFRCKISGKEFLALLGLGVIAYTMSASFYYALLYISASATITLMFQYIWMGIIIQAIAKRRLPRMTIILSGIVVIMGTFLTTGVFEEDLTLNLLGVFFGLLSALGYALFLFLSGRVATRLPAVSRTAFLSVVRLVIAIVLAPGALGQLPALPIVVLFGVPMALLGIIIPLVLIQHAAPHLPNSVTTIMSASELPGGVILAVIFVGEHIGLLQWLGIVLVLGGIFLSQAPEIGELLRRLRSQKAEKAP